tara:strand:- start:959 stop:1135 length:177 start_codon:yes stop_codon:yes gene_type:complete
MNKKTRTYPVLRGEFASYMYVFIGLVILAFGFHDSLAMMTRIDCDRGIAAACENVPNN